MSEAPGDPSVASAPSSPPVPEAVPAASPTLPPREKRTASVRALLESGAHFGHQTRRWDPKMKPYLFGERDGIHIIDLDRTVPMLQAGLEFLRETVAQGGKVLMVGTKRQAQEPIRIEAERAGQFYVNNRWLGGMLTNFRTVRRSIERFKEQLAILEDEEKVAELSKKELSRVSRAVGKYRKSLDGIREMSRLPDALFLIDLKKEHIAVTEARRLGIPMMAVVDSNCSPDGIDFPVPGNDDAVRAIQLYCELVADACAEGAEIHNERIQSEVSEAGAGGRERPQGARRVVEIKPAGSGGGRSRGAAGRDGPRRPRQAGGTHSAGGRRDAAPGTPAPETPAAKAEAPAPTAEATEGAPAAAPEGAAPTPETAGE